MRFAMIMAGGAGTRLWPMSRVARPKQLLPLMNRDNGDAAEGEPQTQSLLEMAAGRLDGIVPPERQYICTSERYREAIESSLPRFAGERILGEPVGRDTVNAVGFAAAVFEKQDPDAVFIVLTADHMIRPQEVFRERADLAFRLVEQDPKRLVTFSIKPTHAATGYGYVERGREITGIDGGKGLAFKVARFVEKPPMHKAQAYFESGLFAWNSGMFVFSAKTFLSCLQRYKPESWQGLMRIAESWRTSKQREVINAVYPSLEKISVDYAVMEPASHDNRVSICTVITDVEWMDVGSWPSYGATLSADRSGNRVGAAAVGRTELTGSRDNLVVSDDPAHTIALLGCHDLIVVHTADATLVMPRDKAEELKKLHEKVPDELK